MDNEQSNNETALIPAQTGGQVAAPLTGLAARFAADAGMGLENVTQDAMAIPFLRLLQAKSPEVENDPDNYKPGMLVHSVTGARYDIREKGGNPLPFLQCHFEKQIVEWGDKEKGNGGLKKRHACTPAALARLEKLPRNDKGKPLAPGTDGNILEETAYHYMLLLDPHGVEVGVLPLKSTGLTPSKKLMRTVHSQLNAPTFAKVYAVQSFLDKQKSGAQNTFMNVRFALVGDVTDEASYDAAMAFYKSVIKGEAKLDDDAEAGAAAAGAGAETPDDDNVPF